MTVTDTDVPSTVTSDAPVLAPPRPATGFAGLVGSGAHATVGRLWIGTSFLFLIVSAVMGGMLGVEKIDVSGIDVLGTDTVAQVTSLHAVGFVFLFLLPLLLGLAIAIVPRQVGSVTVAFPRAAAAAYWGYLVSGAIVVGSFAADGGPGGSDIDAIALFVAAMIGLLAALCLGAVCVATTAIAMRAEGMTMWRIPLFSWANVVATAVWLLTLPVLAGVLLLVYVDVRYGPVLVGSGEQIYLRMSWAWSQPAVYMYAIPVLGLVGDIVPVAGRTRITLHRVAMTLIAAFGVLSFGAWAMPGFAPSTDGQLPLVYVGEVPFVAYSVLILVPLVALFGLLADTLRRGTVQLMSPLVWAMSALLMLLAGGINGALVSIDPFDLINTTATTSQIHFVLAAATLGLFGGLVYWAPLLWGRVIPDGPSTALAGLGLVGTLVLCIPDLISGFLDQLALLGGVPADVSSGTTDFIEALNLVSLIGAGLLALVALGFLGLLLRTAFGRDDGDADTDADPWGGHTLEWVAGDPPPVSSEAPLYDARHAAEVAS